MTFEHAMRPGQIGTLALPNRIIMGSMHLGIESDPDDGRALAAFYAERARGQAALIVTGGSAVSKVGAGGRNYGFVNDPAQAPALRRVTEAVHAANGRIALQLFHAGRYAFASTFGLQPVAPSEVPSRFSPDPPRALSDAEIRETIEDFAQGAQRSRAYGFDAIEVMASEGYLLNQFLSPLTNRRDDEWGGDFERRMHFPRAVLRAIRTVVGDDFPIIFRISGADLMEGSTTAEETLEFARALASDGVDAINVGVGWHESPVPTVQQLVPPGAWVQYAHAIKETVGALPVIASNRVNTLALADTVLREGRVDFISMARPFLADAQIVAKGASGSVAFVNTCIACNQACIDRSLSDEPVSCMTNPRAVRELAYPEQRTDTARRFAVIGGGPAGMEAARALGALGHRVDLFEAESELGGQFRMARRIPGKSDFGETIRYFAHELPRLGVRVHLDRRIGENEVPLLREFDGIVIATGVLPRRADLAGSDLPHVVSYIDALLHDRIAGTRVAIVGAGGIGVDVAHRLSCEEPGHARKDVTLMRRGSTIGEHIGKTTRWTVLRALRQAGVQIYAGITYERIAVDGVHIRDAKDEPRLVEADTVVIAAGQERNDALLTPIARLGIPYRVVGGAHDAAELNAVRAFDEGLRAAHELATISRSAHATAQGAR